MPLSKAHPLRDIHASHSRKLTISVRAIPKPLPASLSFPRSHFRLFSFSFVFYFSFILRSCYVRSRSHPLPGTNVSTGRTACSFLADICSVSDRRQPTRSRASRKGSARLSATSSTNRRRSQRAKCGNASSTLYDSGNERA